MNTEINKLCKQGEYGEAIDFALHSSKADRRKRLKEVVVFVDKNLANQERDRVLKSLIFKLCEGRCFREAFPCLELIADKELADQLEQGLVSAMRDLRDRSA